MKRISALVLIAFMVAGCASGKKGVAGPRPAKPFRGPGGIVVTGRATIRHVKPGTPVVCKGGPTLTVPHGVAAVGVVHGPAPATRMSLSRSLNGTVEVSCSGN